MADYKLTYAIVTFNRKRELEINIKNLISIANRYPMEILVCDNASNDGTQQLCELYAAKHSFFTYFRQATNIGYDGNVLTAFIKAKSAYVWLHGDTRTIDAQYFEELWNVIMSEKYDSISFHSNPEYDLNHKEITDISQLLRTVGFRYSLVGSFIVRKPLKDPELYSQYRNLRFMHIPFLFEKLCSLKTSNNLIVYNKYFRLIELKRASGQFWNAHIFETFSRCWFYTIMSLPNQLTVDAKLICLKGEANEHIFSYKNILRKYAFGKINREDYLLGKPYLEFTSHSRTKYIDLIFLVPRNIYLVLIIAAKKIKSVWK